MDESAAAAPPFKTLAEMDGPKGLPLVGNLPQIDLPRFHQQLEAWCDEFGPIFKIRIGRRTRIVIADVEIANHMLRERPDLYRRNRNVERVIGEMGFNGLFSSEGDSWRRQRKLVAQALNSAHLHQFFENLIVTANRLRRRWERAADAGDAVDLGDDLMRFTVDVTVQLAFGIDFNTIETEGPVVQQNLDKVFPMLMRRLFSPFPYWRYFRLRQDRELERALVELRQQVEAIIGACKERMAADPSLYDAPTNFLEAVIAAQRDENIEYREEDIYANVLTLLLAGEDTTANTLGWAANFLIDQPLQMAKARDEVDAVLGLDATPVRFEQLSKLKFIDAFANETMRLRPVAPFLGLDCNADVELLGYHLPKGSSMLVLTRQLAKSAENFGDPDQFNPQRWMNAAPEPGCPHNPKAFLPFGTGPRFCPGRNLAIVEIKVVLAMLCRNFEIELADPDLAVEEELSFTMMPTNLVVKFKRRLQ